VSSWPYDKLVRSFWRDGQTGLYAAMHTAVLFVQNLVFAQLRKCQLGHRGPAPPSSYAT